MGEYAPLVQRLGGQVIEIAPDSPHHISPMDLQMNANDDESPLSMKADFLLSLCELIVGGREGLQPIEKTVIDRCVRLVYREMALGLETAKTPLLQDLYEELLKQPEPEARRVATALELYCTGSLNLFNHPTNVNLNSRVVCIVLKGLGENLRKIAMHTTNEFVTAAVNANHKAGIATWCYPAVGRGGRGRNGGRQMKFTNSPYETMMQQVPRYERPEPVKAPEGSRCHGCPYWRGIGCVTC